MSDFSRKFNPWHNFKNGLYLTGAEVNDDAEAPEGWSFDYYLFSGCRIQSTSFDIRAMMRLAKSCLSMVVKDSR